jgi:D-psicose/D-tagatose/L-ribulose 3-epimerase
VKLSYMMFDPITDLQELSRRMAVLRSLGYDGIELSASHPLGYAIEDLAALTETHQLPVVSFLSGWSYAHEKLCLASPDAAIRARAAARIGDYVRQASALGALVVVGLMQGLRSDEPDEAVASARIVECLKRTAQVAEELGGSIVIEPVNHLQVGFNHTAAEAAALAERVGSPALGFMLDTIHMNIEERSAIGTIEEYGARARHFHLCETNGGPFGSGGLDFPRVLAALRASGYDRFVSLKIYRHARWEQSARDSLAFLRQCGLRPEG